MDKTLLIKTNKWFKTVLVWGLYRVIYNIYMVIVGLIGIAILHVTIPSLYILVGLLFNVLYTFLAPIDLLIKNITAKDKSIIIFSTYCVFCTLIVIGVPVLGVVLL